MTATTSQESAGAPYGGRLRRLWRSCAYLTGLVGLLCATEAWGWQLSLAAAVCSGFLVVIIGLPFTEGTLAAMRLLYGRGALAGAALVAATGLVVVGGLAGAVLVLMLVASWPRLRDLARSRWPTVFKGGGFSGTTPDVEPTPVPDAESLLPSTDLRDLRDLDDEALCLVWRHTFVALQASRSPSHRLWVVRQREDILDELQRRCPAGFDAWLAAGARAPSNPLPFVRRPSTRAEDPPLGG